MSHTPAAELARLRREFPLWSIRSVRPGKGIGFTAHRQKERVYAPTLRDLERVLREKRLPQHHRVAS